MPEVQFIGNDLSSMKIKKYPIILLEFLNGFYTTIEDIDNIFFDDMRLNEPSVFIDLLVLNQHLRKIIGAPRNITLQSLKEQKQLYNKTFNELETIKAQYNKKHEEFVLSMKKHVGIIQLKQEYNSSNEILKKRQMVEESIKGKNNLLRQSIIKLKALNKTIYDSVRIIERSIETYKKELINKRKKLSPLNIKMAHNKKANRIHIKRFLSECSFVFFNQRLCKYITLPPFYHEAFSNKNKIKRLTYFENNEKRISLFLGFVVQIITYISKSLNIPMRYPLYVHGSSSSLVKGVK